MLNFSRGRRPTRRARTPFDVTLGPDQADFGFVLNADMRIAPDVQRGLRQPGLTHLTLSSEECRLINTHRNLERYLEHRSRGRSPSTREAEEGNTMGRKYQVISADGHVETPPVWTKYVPEQWQDRAPRLVQPARGRRGLAHRGSAHAAQRPEHHRPRPDQLRRRVVLQARRLRRTTAPATPRSGCASRTRTASTPRCCSRRCSRRGSSRASKTARSIARWCARYNTWLGQDYCSVAPDRLIGNSVTPITNIDDAVAELKSSHALGLQSVAFYQFPNGTGFSEPEDDAFWAACLELGMAISPHFGFGEIRAPLAGAAQGTAGQAYASALTQRAGAHSPVYCMAQLMAAGVFDRFPDIKFYFAETNASWLPSSLYFMDDNHEIFSSAFGGRKMALTPSEYVQKHCYFSIIRDPVAVEMADKLPLDNIMWGTDFPHSVGSFPHSQEFLDTAFAGQPELRRKIVLENPAALLRARPRRRHHRDAGRGLATARRMARLLVVHHTPSPAVHDMVEAARAGARDPAIEGVEVVVRPALHATASDVLDADGYLLGTPGQPRVHVGRAQALLRHRSTTRASPRPSAARTGCSCTATSTSTARSSASRRSSPACSGCAPRPRSPSSAPRAADDLAACDRAGRGRSSAGSGAR